MSDIEELKRQGLSMQAISKLTGFDRKTIRKDLAKRVWLRSSCLFFGGRISRLRLRESDQMSDSGHRDAGMTGFDLQRELQLRDQKIPIVFITAQTDGASRARAFEGGAVGFLLKPFSDTVLLSSVEAALRTT